MAARMISRRRSRAICSPTVDRIAPAQNGAGLNNVGLRVDHWSIAPFNRPLRKFARTLRCAPLFVAKKVKKSISCPRQTSGT